jgi:hypothetical protein
MGQLYNAPIFLKGLSRDRAMRTAPVQMISVKKEGERELCGSEDGKGARRRQAAALREDEDGRGEEQKDTETEGRMETTEKRIDDEDSR